MTHCYWIRHAPIEATGRYTGQSDVPAIIPDYAPRLCLPTGALWFASPLQRAAQTAQWLTAQPVQYAAELMEQSFGAWEGRYYDEVWQEAQHAYDWSRPEAIRPPGGESFEDVCARVDGWLARLLKEKHESMVIVTHAGVIRAGLRHIFGMTPAEALSIEVEPLSLHHVEYIAAEPIAGKLHSRAIISDT